jgi:hypothetical protein
LTNILIYQSSHKLSDSSNLTITYLSKTTCPLAANHTNTVFTQLQKCVTVTFPTSLRHKTLTIATAAAAYPPSALTRILLTIHTFYLPSPQWNRVTFGWSTTAWTAGYIQRMSWGMRVSSLRRMWSIGTVGMTIGRILKF